MIALVATGAGCRNGFIDPSEMGRYQKSLPIPILRVLDAGIDEPDPKWRNATPVTAEDLLPTPGDYVLGRNDYVAISITDLIGPNIESVVQKRASAKAARSASR